MAESTSVVLEVVGMRKPLHHRGEASGVPHPQTEPRTIAATLDVNQISGSSSASSSPDPGRSPVATAPGNTKLTDLLREGVQAADAPIRSGDRKRNFCVIINETPPTPKSR